MLESCVRKNPTSVQKVVSGICNLFSSSLQTNTTKAKKRINAVMSPLQADDGDRASSNQGSNSRTPSGLLSEESSDSSPPCNRTLSVNVNTSQDGIVFCTQQPADDPYVLVKVSPASSTGTTAFEPFPDNPSASGHRYTEQSLQSEFSVTFAIHIGIHCSV